MKLSWDETSYRWARDSSKYTGFDLKLSEILLEKIGQYEESSAGKMSSVHEQNGLYGTLCDMGCGAGEVDLVLAPYFDRVTCVDIDPVVINRLSQTVEEEKIGNISTVCADGEDITEHFDRVIALFHARSIDLIRKYLKIADKQLILVVRDSKMTEIGVDEYKSLDCFDTGSMKNALDEAGIRYTFSKHSIEHGQPFQNYTEAVEFVMKYCEISEIDRAKEYLNVKLEYTGEKEFPYYLPKMKKMGIFVINTQSEELL